MHPTLRHLVVAAVVGLVACGGKASNPDGGTAGGAAGSGATGRGGATGTAGEFGTGGRGGAAGSGTAGSGGAGGSATGVAGTQGTAGTGTAGGGAAGSAGGTAGGAGTGGRGGGVAGSGGGAGRGGTTGTAGEFGTGGRGGAAGTAGAAGSAGRGGSAGTGVGGGTAGGGGAGRGGAGGAAGSGGTDERCNAPADCSGSPGEASGLCLPRWSCVDFRCTAECMGGRTCVEMPDSACLVCQTSSGNPMSEGCPGTACAIDPSRIASVSQVTCVSSPPPDFSTWHCTGRWATLPDGSICTIQTIPVDSIQWTVSCGGCVTQVSIR